MRPLDLAGNRFGSLVAVRAVGSDSAGRKLWECSCDCGNVTIAASHNLKNKYHTSCGCSRLLPRNKKIKEVKMDKMKSIVAKVEGATKKQVEDLLMQCSGKRGYDDFELGGLLEKIKINGWWTGHTNFSDYVEATTGISYRSAGYCMTTYRNLVDANISFEEVEHVGWTKLRRISSMLTQKNKQEWIDLCEKMNVKQLDHHIRELPGGSSTKKFRHQTIPEITSITFTMLAGQKKQLLKNLEKAKADVGTTNDAEALLAVMSIYDEVVVEAVNES